ncbi:MAG: hypothetical protein AAGB48_03285 [Planctomycetota bacterium]
MLSVVVVLAGVVGSAGCQRFLFREDQDRTQFARYDRVRGDDVPTHRQDEFGKRVPNLRGRLLSTP